MHLIRTYNRNAFQVISNVTLENSSLRESSYSVPLNTVNKNCLTVSLLNTRSLRRHAQDITKGINLIENDVLSAVCDGNPDFSRK